MRRASVAAHWRCARSRVRLSTPPPCIRQLVEFCNSPQLLLQLEAVAKAGVKEVILAISYSPNVMEDFLLKAQADLGIKIVCSHEPEPLGTAGPIAYARDYLNTKEPFFVISGNVTCDFPLTQLLAFHRAHGREGTCYVTKVRRSGAKRHEGPAARACACERSPRSRG